MQSETKRGTLPSCSVKKWLLLPWRETTKIKDLERRMNKERSLGFKWTPLLGCIIAQTDQEDASFCILKGNLGQLSTIFVSWHCDICEITAFIFSQFCKHSVSVSMFFLLSFRFRLNSCSNYRFIVQLLFVWLPLQTVRQGSSFKLTQYLQFSAFLLYRSQ